MCFNSVDKSLVCHGEPWLLQSLFQSWMIAWSRVQQRVSKVPCLFEKKLKNKYQDQYRAVTLKHHVKLTNSIALSH